MTEQCPKGHVMKEVMMYGKFVTRCMDCYSEKQRAGAIKMWQERHARAYWEAMNRKDGLLVG